MCDSGMKYLNKVPPRRQLTVADPALAYQARGVFCVSGF